MTLMCWTPWNELETMHQRLGQLAGEEDELLSNAEATLWSPVMDIHEAGDAYLLQAELPGIDKKDVHIEVDHGMLTISGERLMGRNVAKDVDEEYAHHVERAFGHFMRSFSLPTHVDAEHVTAHMQDGVLDVRLPKKESEQARHITIGA